MLDGNAYMAGWLKLAGYPQGARMIWLVYEPDSPEWQQVDNSKELNIR